MQRTARVLTSGAHGVGRSTKTDDQLVLRHAEGLSYAEIAELLNVPNGTAKGWVSRGRAAMLLAPTEKNGAA